tara:strand:+ start:1298 stop:1474 length:177 start_codon:yes stop_codon:yes gene_type:complete
MAKRPQIQRGGVNKMREMADLYDPKTPIHENQPCVTKVRELKAEWARQLNARQQQEEE